MLVVLTSILPKLSGKILVFELWIKKVLTNNIALFFKLAFSIDFLVGDVITWSQPSESPWVILSEQAQGLMVMMYCTSEIAP